jgi:hypothetical protein
MTVDSRHGDAPRRERAEGGDHADGGAGAEKKDAEESGAGIAPPFGFPRIVVVVLLVLARAAALLFRLPSV